MTSATRRPCSGVAGWAAGTATTAVGIDVSDSAFRGVTGITGWIAPEFLPAPSEVISAGWRLPLNGELPTNIAISFRPAVSGFLVGGSLAFAFG